MEPDDATRNQSPAGGASLLIATDRGAALYSLLIALPSPPKTAPRGRGSARFRGCAQRQTAAAIRWILLLPTGRIHARARQVSPPHGADFAYRRWPGPKCADGALAER